ncbi:MarR family winged helix-turn-helix transcriptional regulator [Streptomyces sp. NPDC002755]|uniref:MarR family winged helix-turn-helix transcriptional regulator n=1 Tax=Streptomyces sp. NPDC002884 TaxID=3154544 RepID=UPI00331CBF46
MARAHRATAGQLLRRIGLYARQALLVMRLWEAGPQRQSLMIRHPGLDPSTVTRMVQRLEQAGFVTRTADPEDRRAVLVEATSAGEALRGEVDRVWQELERRTLAGLNDVDQTQLARLLARLEGNLAADRPRRTVLRPGDSSARKKSAAARSVRSTCLSATPRGPDLAHELRSQPWKSGGGMYGPSSMCAPRRARRRASPSSGRRR